MSRYFEKATKTWKKISICFDSTTYLLMWFKNFPFFFDLLTISELYVILTLSGLVSMAVCFFKIRLAKFESQGPILSIFNLFSLRFMKLWVRFLRKKLLALCITPRTFFITTKKKCWNCQKVWNAIPSAGSWLVVCIRCYTLNFE